MRTRHNRSAAAVAGFTLLLLAVVAACTHLTRRGTPVAPPVALTLGTGTEAVCLAPIEQQVTAELRDQMVQVHVALTFRAPVGQLPTDGLFRADRAHLHRFPAVGG